MPRDIRVARPFQIEGTDGETHEYGIAYYPQVSDTIADHWYVLWHCQASVLSRGLNLVQYRWLNNVIQGSTPLMIWLDASNASIYTTDIEPGWAPIFIDDLTGFPALDLPAVPDFHAVGVDLASGKTLYRPDFSTDRIMRSHHPSPRPPATRIYPGDPDPPIARASDPNIGRTESEEAAHRSMQAAQLQATTLQAARYVDAPPDARPIALRPRPPESVYSFVDPRQ